MVEITKVLLLYKVDDKVSCVSSLMLNSFCLRRPQDKWETMIGWNAPEDYDETGKLIEFHRIFFKKKRKKKLIEYTCFHVQIGFRW